MAALASEVMRFSLAIWVGGTLVALLAAPVIFREIPSRDLSGGVFGEILRRFEALKHLLSLLLVMAVFVRLEQRGELAVLEIVSGFAIFVSVATNVYLAMVLRPRMKYCRLKVGSFDSAAADNPWKLRFDRLHRRSVRILLLGWFAAATALAAET